MMSLFRSFFGMVGALFNKSQLDRRLQDELQLHINLLAEKNINLGMNHEEAWRRARIAVGGLDQTRECVHDARGFTRFSDLQRNFRHSFRRLLKAPLLSLVVILSLGMGIGTNTAIFSAMRQILLRPLPVEKPEELALATTPGMPPVIGGGPSGGAEFAFSYPGFREMERQQERNVAELAGFKYLLKTNIVYKDEAVPGSALTVSGGYFPIMRVRPLMGRMLIPADDQGHGNPVAILGYSFWKRNLGGQPEALNQQIRIFGQVFTIVGVAPREFYGTTLGLSPDVIIPLASVAAFPKNIQDTVLTSLSSIFLVARIKPGLTREQVAASYAGVYSTVLDKEIKARSNWLDPNQVQQMRKTRLTFIDGSRGHSGMQEFFKYPLYILIAATCMVLLIAMVNAANLLLTRSAARRRELAICAAIGADRRQIVSQLLSEALLLALAGGVAGIALSMLIMSALKLLLTQALVMDSSISIDFLKMDLEWPVLLYGLGLSVFTGLLFGLYPALEAARVAPIKVLNQESGHISEAPASAHVRKSLVCAQVMLSAVLLIPTGLFLKSLVMLGNVDLGMRTRNIITFRLNPAVSGYTSEQKRSLFERMEQAVAAIPGVSGVTSTDYPLLNYETRNSNVMIDGHAAGKVSRYILVGTGFFRQMGIPLLMGRDFNEHDSLAGQKVAIVNEKFVKTFFNGQNPIGRKIRQPKSDTEIVGVAKDTSISSVGEKPAETFYLPWRQNEIINSASDSGMTFYVRFSLPSNQVVAQVRKVAQSVDPNIPLEGFRPLEDQVDVCLVPERLLFQIAGTLAVLATALAMMGLYGVMAYSVVRRTREIGIRMAIGANPSEIRHMVLREMLRIVSVGLVLGVPLALVISKIAESVLFGVKAYDPIVVLGASLALGLAAFASTYLPAWKASRVDPLFALRAE